MKCVGEDNVIDPLQRCLKQKRSEVYKRAIFFMNREKEIESAITLSQVDFYRSCSLALGAFVYAQFVVTRDGYARLTDLSVNVSEQS